MLGYGKLWWGGKVQLAHRLAWIAWFGPIEEGKFVCHHCDNPSCIEVSHLFVGTQKDNMRDCASKGRTLPQKRRINFTVGEDRHSAKLTQAQIEEVIRRRGAGETYAQIAVDYPISRQQISRVCRGLSWQHLRRRAEADRLLHTKVSDAVVAEIRLRRAKGSALADLAHTYGLSYNYVWHLCHNHHRKGYYRYRPSRVGVLLTEGTT